MRVSYVLSQGRVERVRCGGAGGWGGERRGDGMDSVDRLLGKLSSYLRFRERNFTLVE